MTRREWLTMLAALAYPANPAAAGQAFRVFEPMLADMPDGAFTRASLDAVVLAPRKMAIPSYDEIRNPLAAWWRENRPYPTALPGPRPPERHAPTEAECAHVSRLVRAFTAERAGVSASMHTDDPLRPPARYLRPDELAAAYRQQAASADPVQRGIAEARIKGLGERV